MSRTLFLLTLAMMLMANPSVAADPADIAALKQKAEEGDAKAQLELSVVYDTGKDVPKDSVEAMKWRRKAAEQGLALAQVSLGLRFAMGFGVPKDSSEAVKWYRKAAEQGLAYAQYLLGEMLANGDGVPRDSREAVKWYRKAAYQGQASAQFNLGCMYADGVGVPKDEIEALAWFNIAASERENEADIIRQQEKQSIEGQIKELQIEGQALVDKYKELKDMADKINAPSGIGITEQQAQSVLGQVQSKQQELQRLKQSLAKLERPAVINRDILESRLGREMTLVAQQRSKDLTEEMATDQKSVDGVSPHSSRPPIATEVYKHKASGSGAIVTTKGHILTAAHVVAGAKSIKVISSQGVSSAALLRIDETNDLAVIKLTDGSYPALPIAPSRGVQLGQTVSTIGFPNLELQGYSPKVTRGEISSTSGYGDDPTTWQISVPVQSGNSGGPLFDGSGNVIGVVVAKLSIKAAKITGDLPQNVGYAVKSAYALAILEPYLNNDAPEPKIGAANIRFEDMVANAKQGVVLILVY